METELLDLWHRCAGAPVIMRPAILLEELCAEQDAARLPVGRRDRKLIRLRTKMFGADVDCNCDCEKCGSRIEIRFDLTALPDDTEVPDHIAVEYGESNFSFRLPGTGDVAEIMGISPTRRAEALVQQCALETLPEPLPRDLVSKASSTFEAVDPDAEITLQMTCPECGVGSAALFDIGVHFWQDICRSVRRILREVHYFASAYGWTEAQVLAVPRYRRQEYLRLGGA